MTKTKNFYTRWLKNTFKFTDIHVFENWSFIKEAGIPELIDDHISQKDNHGHMNLIVKRLQEIDLY